MLEDLIGGALAKLGASPEEIAWVFEPGIPDDEVGRRARQISRSHTQARLGEAGFFPEEVAALMDRSGTPAERVARRRAAIEARTARQPAPPGALEALIDRLLDDPEMDAELEAAAGRDR